MREDVYIKEEYVVKITPHGYKEPVYYLETNFMFGLHGTEQVCSFTDATKMDRSEAQETYNFLLSRYPAQRIDILPLHPDLPNTEVGPFIVKIDRNEIFSDYLVPGSGFSLYSLDPTHKESAAKFDTIGKALEALKTHYYNKTLYYQPIILDIGAHPRLWEDSIHERKARLDEVSKHQDLVVDEPEEDREPKELNGKYFIGVDTKMDTREYFSYLNEIASPVFAIVGKNNLEYAIGFDKAEDAQDIADRFKRTFGDNPDRHIIIASTIAVFDRKGVKISPSSEHSSDSP